jgi:peptide deformylase
MWPLKYIKNASKRMILPIIGYGHPVLKKVATDISPDYPQYEQLLADMWETMYHADGIGLAAPQIGLSIRFFLIDTLHIERETQVETDMPLKCGFINAKVISESGEKWAFEEGCLSIPKVRGQVSRHPDVWVEYLDEAFQPHKALFTGINARVIQHEYDHIEGKLFTEYLSPFKKRLIHKKLEAIKAGNVDTDYRMKFAPTR